MGTKAVLESKALKQYQVVSGIFPIRELKEPCLLWFHEIIKSYKYECCLNWWYNMAHSYGLGKVLYS